MGTYNTYTGLLINFKVDQGRWLMKSRKMGKFGYVGTATTLHSLLTQLTSAMRAYLVTKWTITSHTPGQQGTIIGEFLSENNIGGWSQLTSGGIDTSGAQGLS